MSNHEDLIQATCDWLTYAAQSAGLAADEVVPADDPGPRPDLTYLTVKIDSYDDPVGYDEVYPGYTYSAPLRIDVPNQSVRGHRNAMITVHGYGENAHDWIERAKLLLGIEAVEATILAAEQFAIEPEGPIRNMTGLLDTSRQVHLVQEFRAMYGISDGPINQTPLSAVEINLVAGSKEAGAADEYTETLTYSV